VKISWRAKAGSFGRKGSLMPFIELAFGVYVTICIVLSFQKGLSLFFSLPFLIVFAVGYFYVGIYTLWGTWISKIRRSDEAEPGLKSSAA